MSGWFRFHGGCFGWEGMEKEDQCGRRSATIADKDVMGPVREQLSPAGFPGVWSFESHTEIVAGEEQLDAGEAQKTSLHVPFHFTIQGDGKPRNFCQSTNWNH